jgi:hypothetical protein
VVRSTSREDSGVPALALAPCLIDTVGGADTRTLEHELLDRATQPDYRAWLARVGIASGCSRPIRLRGTIRDINPATGEIVRTLDTESLPDGVLYIPCGDRRASVCPACSEAYRRDAYQLIRAGLTGGKGVPETVSAHPCVFATFTAPSLGPVHTRNESPDGRTVRCRPRRKSTMCPHGRRMSCGQRHTATDTCLGRPLCADCYDYAAAVVWNVHAPELWRRTTIAIRRRLARTASAYQDGTVQLSYAKVAEFQARGLVHFHAVFRLDAIGPAGQLTPPPLTAEQLAAIQTAAAATWFATVAHPVKPKGWDIRWGRQIDTQVVRLPANSGSPNIAVASYLAKYATKSTEAVGAVNCRITADNLAYYSTTLRALRQARADYRRRQLPGSTGGPAGQAVVTVTTLQWAGAGWRSSGDALLALSAAARARDHERAGHDEAQFS